MPTPNDYVTNDIATKAKIKAFCNKFASVAAIEAFVDSVNAAETGLDARVDALEATVDTAETGLSAVVADHETRIGVLEAPP